MLKPVIEFTRKDSLIDLIKRCSSFKQLQIAHTIMAKTNLNEDCFVINQFVGACSSFHRMDDAFHVVTQMRKPNVFVYNALIRGFVTSNFPVRALLVYLDLIRANIVPSSYTFVSLVKGCTLLLALRFGECIHGHVWRFGFASHLFIQTSLIDFYSSFGTIVEAKKVFDEMLERDAFAWTTMVSSYMQMGNLCYARDLFNEMPEKSTATWNTMIDGYAKAGDVEAALLLFNEMPKKDKITWTILINCYAQNKQYIEALAIFDEMKSHLISPDEVTMAAVISACAHVGALDLGKEIHLYVAKTGFDLDVYLGSALVDMYAKCGSLDRSLLVFFKLREKNLFCWNSIIEGLGSHGYAAEALTMFSRMKRDNIKPNSVTFISVLSACTHAGLVEEGRKIFINMINNYGISPEIQHYGCMVDLLCKAGLINDALILIENMEIEPNSVIWGSLLGGCKLHDKLDIAQIPVSKLKILEPNNSGYYNLLVNMYAEANRWSEVAKVRSLMRTLGVEKTFPGSSWVELDNKIHLFAASDKSHPGLEKILLVLSELDEHLKLVSHQPEIGVS